MTYPSARGPGVRSRDSDDYCDDDGGADDADDDDAAASDDGADGRNPPCPRDGLSSPSADATGYREY